jgi:aldehyde dehydrogenase (NAD+)
MSMTPAPLNLLPKLGALIGDKLVTDLTGGEVQHVYAATGEPTMKVGLAGQREVELAARAARQALPAWKAISTDTRRRLLLKVAELIRAEGEFLATLTAVDSGVPKLAALAGAMWGADFLEYNAGWVDRIGGEIRPTAQGRQVLAYTRDEPYGVIGAITPFNAPVIATCMVLGPVLAAGNTIVVKPSSLAPYAVLRLGQLFLEAGFPPGVVNILPGTAHAGEALVRSPDVDKMFFEGSTKSARFVLVAAAESGPKPVALELGGKSPAIVFDDSDLEAAVASVVGGGFSLGGQGCVLGTRLLVQASIYDQFVERAAQITKAVKVGDPFAASTMMGPIVNSAACERILGVMSHAAESGQGRIIAGGGRFGGDLASGYFVEPTVFADVDNASPLAREEIFGPVLSIVRFETEDEAVRLANDSPYGLGAYVHSRDVSRVHRLADSLEAGVVFINGMPAGGPTPGLPFGGVKHSGSGRLGGIEAIREFTRTKTVTLFL